MAVTKEKREKKKRTQGLFFSLANSHWNTSFEKKTHFYPRLFDPLHSLSSDSWWKKKKLNLITRDGSIETSKLIETDKKKKTYKNWIFRREDKLLQLNRFTALIMRIWKIIILCAKK